MQVFVFFCIVLCLVVDANTRSVTDIDDESSVEGLSQLLKRGSGDSERDFCNPNPCKNGGLCSYDGKYDWTCSCYYGYSGSRCEKCTCENGFCKEVNSSHTVCTCPPEWGFFKSTSCKRCDCGKDSNCTFNPSSRSNGKICLCRVGYEDRNGICKGTCNTNPCLNGGECRVNGTDIECRCKIPFVGEFCEKKEDPCVSYPCQNGGTCKWNGAESYTCKCAERFGGKHCDSEICTPEEIEDCGGVQCVYNKSLERAVCDCEEGKLFDPKSKTCRDVCSPNPCQNGGICRAPSGRLSCECKDRFIGAYCSLDVCSPNPCRNGGICNATKGGVTCQCRGSFSGADCSIDVCSPNPCRNGGVCNATSKGVLCQCRDRFKGADCSMDVCSPNPCQNGGVCNATSGGVACQCRRSYRGADCSLNVCSPNSCRNGGNCTATSVGVTCDCRKGFKGADCSIEIPFPPTSTSVSTPTATRNLTSFWTHFPTANETNVTRTIGPTSWTFFPTPTAESSSGGHSFNFTDEIENTARYSTSGPTTGTGPCSESPCQNGGTCVVVSDSWKCLCKKPYLGILCETDPCDWNPCKNGGVCKTENETVSCYCKDPFAGEFCESRIKMDAYVIILVAVSVFLAVVLIFVTCVLCKRYRGTRTS